MYTSKQTYIYIYQVQLLVERYYFLCSLNDILYAILVAAWKRKTRYVQ